MTGLPLSSMLFAQKLWLFVYLAYLTFENCGSVIFQILCSCVVYGQKLEELIFLNADTLFYLTREPIRDKHTPIVTEGDITAIK